MRKRLAVLSLCAALSALSSAPAYAVEGNEIPMAIGQSLARVSLWGVGTVIGTPIAVLRKTGQNTLETNKNLSEKSENGFVKAGAPLVALPVGIFTGSLEGLYLGPKNAWDNRVEHPLSKDMVSLGELKD